MVTESIPSLYPEIEERRTPPGKGHHGYYRRLRDGWIITAGVWPSMMQDMNFKGLAYLAEYGTFVYGTPWGLTTQLDRRGQPFNAIAEPWRMILQTPGGSEAFPVSQVIAYRWHIRPPYREVHFLQLEGVKVYDLFCPECENGIFSSEVEQDAIDMLRTHLTAAFNRVHDYRPEDLRALGQEVGVDFFAPRRSRRSAKQPPPSVENQVSEVLAVSLATSYRCPTCGAEFESAAKLRGHHMSHRKNAAP